MMTTQRHLEDDAIGRIDALVSLARSAREDSVDQVLRTVVETIHSTAGFDVVVFNMYQPAWDDYEVVLVVGPTYAQVLMDTRESRETFESQLLLSEYEIEPGIFFVPATADVWTDLENFVVPTQQHPIVPGGWDPEDALLVQLRDSKGEPLGILSMDEPRSGLMPDATELRLLRAICSHAEQSLENARTSARSERHSNRLTQLLGASARFAQCQSHREVLDTACETLVPGLGFERVAVYVRDGNDSLQLAQTNVEEMAIASTLEPPIFDLFRDRRRSVGGCWIASARAVHGPARAETRSRRNGVGESAWSDDVLLAPVFDEQGVPRLVFAIEDPVNHLRPSEIECEMVRLLVEQTDSALERVTFRERLEHLADHDPSTGLLNRRALARIPRVEMSPKTATLMLCDLDYFKIVNDSYGHDVGDAVICSFADLLRSLSREQDLAVRLGGDEFMLFLPATSLEQAHSVAERLRVALPPLMMPLVPSGITVSIGLAQIGAEETLSDAMRRADSALYAAKRNGRDQIATD